MGHDQVRCDSLTVVGCWGGVAGSGRDRAVEPPVVEPFEVRHCGELDVLDAGRRAVSVDESPFVGGLERLGEDVVKRVSL